MFSWKNGFGMFHANAQLVGEEILSIGESATAQQVLDKGRDYNTELHKCFEWNNDIAAEKYRLDQARSVLRNLVFTRSDDQVKEDKPEIRVFHVTEQQAKGCEYKPLPTIIKNDNEYQKLLQRAYAELHAFKIKYQHLQELDYILSLIP
jgi:hypothetical protein